MVRARSLLVAVALTATVSPALAERSMPCWMVRAYYYSHTKAQREAFAKKHAITARERAAHAVCLKDEK